MTGPSLLKDLKRSPRLQRYYKKLVAAILILVGSFLLLEHLFQFEGFDLLDIIGHETYGLVLIIIGILIATKYSQWKDLDLANWRNWIR